MVIINHSDFGCLVWQDCFPFISGAHYGINCTRVSSKQSLQWLLCSGEFHLSEKCSVNTGIAEFVSMTATLPSGIIAKNRDNLFQLHVIFFFSAIEYCRALPSLVQLYVTFVSTCILCSNNSAQQMKPHEKQYTLLIFFSQALQPNHGTSVIIIVNPTIKPIRKSQLTHTSLHTLLILVLYVSSSHSLFCSRWSETLCLTRHLSLC